MNQGTSILAEAKAYLSIGLSVIPVGIDKKPLIDWKRYQTCRPSSEELETWFQDPQAQVGIVTGSISGVVAVDIEATAIQEIECFPNTAFSKTGGGGVHLMYRHPGHPVPNVVRLRPGVDIRGDGGYIVAPPSLHKSGKRYEWIVPLNGNLAPLPDDILQEIRKRNPRGPLTEIVQGVEEGKRDVSATRLIGSLLAHYPEGEWESVCWRLVEAWNAQNKPPLPLEQLRKCWDSITRRETRKPDRQAIEAPAQSASPPIATADPFSEPASALLDEPDEPVDWLIEPLIERASIGFIGGEPKQTKSILALHLAISAVTTQQLFGKFTVPKPLRVFYVQEEDGRRRVKRRLKALLRGLGADHSAAVGERLRVAIHQGVRIDEPAWIERLHSELETFKPDLVIFDVLSNLHSQEENSQEAMAKIMTVFKELRDRHGCAILIVHHFKKMGGETGFIRPNQRLRGSSVLAATSENSFYLSSQPDKLIRLDHESKEGPVEPFVYAIEGSWEESIGVRLVYKGKAGPAQQIAKAEAFYAVLYQRYEAAGAEGCTYRALADASRLNENTVRERLKLLQTLGKVQEGTLDGLTKDGKKRKVKCFTPVLSEPAEGDSEA